MPPTKETPAIAGYGWGPPEDVASAYAFLSGKGVAGAAGYVPRRPPLARWAEVDRALAEAIAASGLRLIVVLAPDEADTLARALYVWAEPGPDVITLGHEDLSVSCDISGDNDAANDEQLRALLEDASRELDNGDLAGALLAVATHVRRMRPAPSRPPLRPVH